MMWLAYVRGIYTISGVYARLETDPPWPPLLALIWGARSRDPVQIGYMCMRTLISLGLLLASSVHLALGL
jgi:hypothetical protein